MAWEENSRISLHMLLIAILSRIGVYIWILQVIGGKTKCVKMNETLNQWKAL